MQMRSLGNSGLSTPSLVLGGNVFGWTIDESLSHEILDAFVAGGGRMVDTADMYSTWVPGNAGGESETIIGSWLKRRGRRDDVLVATKVGQEVKGAQGLSGQHIRKSVEESLGRLQTDYIDLYYAHIDDESTPLEETLAAFDELVRSGKVRAIGASNYSADRLRKALAISDEAALAKYTVLQPLYNLVERGAFEEELRDVCEEYAIGVLPYYSLASGFLTGKYRSHADLEGRSRAGSVEKYVNERGFRVVEALADVGQHVRGTATQVALAWLAAQPCVVAPIASATSVAQLEELLGAMRMDLSREQLDLLAGVTDGVAFG